MLIKDAWLGMFIFSLLLHNQLECWICDTEEGVICNKLLFCCIRHLYACRQTFILISPQTTANLKTQMIRVIWKCILEWLINKKMKMCILRSFSLSISLTHSNGDYVYITCIMYIYLSLVHYLNPQVCFLITHPAIIDAACHLTNTPNYVCTEE